MKPGLFTTGRILLIAFVAIISVTLLAWQQKENKQKFPYQKVKTDTIPKKKEPRKIRDLDEVLEEMEKVNIEIDLKNLNEELEKIKPEIEKGLANAKIEIEKALKGIDVEKIKADVEASLKEVDWNKIKVELNESIDKIKETDFEKIKVEMKDLEKEMKKIKPEIEKELAKAKAEVEKAKVEIKEYKSFTEGLEKDGLINKKEGYSIKHKNGELIINGKTQPAEVYNKYRNFLEKHKTLTIEKTDDDFNIDNDDDTE